MNKVTDHYLFSVKQSHLRLDQYLAGITISISNQSDINIPITLNVLDQTGLLGDMNNDNILNISDVVILVGIIMGSQDFQINGDINQDSLIDVIDVVLLVNIILNGE